MKRRIVVTGLGTITPLGNDVPTTWEALVAGHNGIGHITHFDASDMAVRIAAEVKDFDAVAIFGRREARRTDRFALLALEAARQAIADAELEFDGLKQTTGVVIGTGIGGIVSLLKNYDVLKKSGPRRVSPFMIPMMMPNAAAAAVSIAYGLQGPVMSIASACTTGTHAIGEAAAMIRRGQADLMLCGGSEAALHPLSVSAFKNMGALSTRNDEPERASRPFDSERDGFIMGEGAGVLVLETPEHAQQRGARIYAELVGYGSTADASHITAPDESGAGAALAMARALENAGLAPEAVDYINAHGTSTPLNDRMETKAIRQIFGPRADLLPISSTKSMTGHLMGAAGAVEAIACAKTLETGWVHPTINYENPDPECDLNYVPNQAQKLDPRVALSNSFGFGGHNGCLVFRRWEGAK
jgi:3-oxoacyl-[acyl-carrier-protein] synthase II